MTSVRRSSRSIKNNNKKYAEFESDDEDGKLAMFEDSGSDFEEVIKKENNNRKIGINSKGPILSSESEEMSEVDENDEVMPSAQEEVEESRPKIKQKSHKPANLMKKRSNILEKVKPKPSKPASIQTQKPNRSIYFTSTSQNLTKSLCLSESSDSENEEKPPEKMTKLSRKSLSGSKKPSKPIIFQPEAEIKQESSGDEIDFASQLESLAQSSSALVKSEDKSELHKSPKKSPSKNLQSSLLKPEPGPSTSKNILSLLSQAEGAPMSLSDDSDDSETEKSAENSAAPAANSGVISIELPDDSGLVRKRKKKGFDMEAYVKRELNRVQREIQMFKHQSHVLCLISHLRYLNSLAAFPPNNHASAEMLLSVALSMIPSVHNVSAQELNLVHLSSFLSWFRSAFKCLQQDSFEFKHPIEEWLLNAMENFLCDSASQRVILFLLASRSMGWPTRLVLNLDCISYKPEKTISGKLTEILTGDKEAESKKAKLDDEKGAKSPQKKEGTDSSPKKDEKASSAKSRKCPRTDNEGKKSSSPFRKSDTVKSDEKPRKWEENTHKADEKPRKSENAEKCKSSSICKGKKSSEKSEESAGKSKISEKCKSSSRSRSKPQSSEKSEEKPGKVGRSENDTKPKSTSRSRSSKASEKPDKSRKARKSGSSDSENDEDLSAKKSRSRSSKEPSKNTKHEKTTKDEKTRPKSSSSRRKTETEPKSPSISNKLSSQSKSKNPEQGKNKRRLSDAALLEASKRKIHKRTTKSEYFTRTNSDSESDFEPESKKKRAKVAEPKTKNVKSKPEKVSKKGLPYWCEVYVSKSGWITVDIDQGRVNCPQEMEERCGIKPLMYILACNSDASLKDVTRRYAGEKFDTHVRKSRSMTSDWFEETLAPFVRRQRKSIDEEEDKQLEKLATSAPMPTNIGAFKNHPLYALSRHLLKFEAIYPPEAPPLGYIKSEPIYARECVHTLHCRVTWLKEGRMVKIGQEPYKIVKARPKWDRMSGTVIKDKPLEIFGKWQTEIYTPPPAKDGKVPRNEYGNVELFKPWMLPKGTVHIPITGLNRVARKLEIDCAPAMIGWEFSGGGCHPVFDGFVVCEEFQDTLMDAWNAEVEEKERKLKEKKVKRALDNWRKLIKGMLMHEKIRKKYAKKPVPAV